MAVCAEARYKYRISKVQGHDSFESTELNVKVRVERANETSVHRNENLETSGSLLQASSQARGPHAESDGYTLVRHHVDRKEHFLILLNIAEEYRFVERILERQVDEDTRCCIDTLQCPRSVAPLRSSPSY